MSLTVRDYSIPTAGLKIQTAGHYLLVVEAEKPVNITFLRANTDVGDVRGVNAGFRFGPAVQAFDKVLVASEDGETQTVKIAIADDQVDYNALSGVVDVSGSEVVSEPVLWADIMAGRVYGASATNTANEVAGSYAVVGLKNPDNSGVILIVIEATPHLGYWSFSGQSIQPTDLSNGLSKSSGTASVAGLWGGYWPNKGGVRASEKQRLPWLVYPGDSLVMTATQDDLPITEAIFEWVERPL